MVIASASSSSVTGSQSRPRHDLLYIYVQYRWQTEAIAGRLAADWLLGSQPETWYAI
jgi:hypothetical protein